MSVIVLGWDGLDLELIERFGLGDSFGTHRDTIATHCNPAIGEPHTHELWPSMITGLHPSDHGILAATEGEGLEWNNPVLNTASTIGNGLVPQDLLTRIGGALRKRGVGVDKKTRQYYKDRDIGTVFDDIGGRAISIPNYQTRFDRAHDLDAHRDELWKALAVESYNNNGKKPQVDLPEVYSLLGSEVGVRVGHTIQAIAESEPLIWTWFGLLDSVGHMQPAVGDHLVQDWYQMAANTTEHIRELADDDTTIISISDHGIQNGNHTHYATVCADDPEPVRAIDHVFDTAEWVRAQDFEQSHIPTEIDANDQAAVRDDLEALGYI